MPYERPSEGHYAVATKVTAHGAPCVEDGFVGIAIKQKATSWQAGLSAQSSIAIGEPFHIRIGGIRQVPFVGGAVKGSKVWITVATNALTVAASATTGQLPFGVVDEVQGQRGTPTGFMRVNMEHYPVTPAAVA